MMDSTLQCCLWIIFISATTSAYRQPYSSDYSGYVDNPYAYGYTPSLNRRHDTHTHHGGFNHERLYAARSAEREIAESQSQEDRPFQSQRMNERSIAVTSNIQRVNHQERKRLQTREDDSDRGESGSFKVVNKYPLTNRRGATEDRVVFPGQTSDGTHVQTRQSPVSVLDNLPEECKELGICDSLPDEEAYNQIVRPALEKCGAADRSIDELDKPEIAQRIGSDSMEQHLCTFQERVMLPKAGKDKDDKWHIVLNRNDDPIQGYRVEICQQGRSNCTSGIFHFYKGYSGYCKQKYTYRPMTAVDPATDSTYSVSLKVPSCCSCVAVQI